MKSSIAIPVILKVGKGALDGIGTYLKDEGFKQVVIYFGNGLIDLFGMKVMESLKQEGVNVLEYRELDTVSMDAGKIGLWHYCRYRGYQDCTGEIYLFRYR